MGTARLEAFVDRARGVTKRVGAGKQALVLEWVSLAGHNKAAQTLDLSALFKGTN